jgi:hypothetical protein
MGSPRTNAAQEGQADEERHQVGVTIQARNYRGQAGKCRRRQGKIAAHVPSLQESSSDNA